MVSFRKENVVFFISQAYYFVQFSILVTKGAMILVAAEIRICSLLLFDYNDTPLSLVSVFTISVWYFLSNYLLWTNICSLPLSIYCNCKCKSIVILRSRYLSLLSLFRRVINTVRRSHYNLAKKTWIEELKFKYFQQILKVQFISYLPDEIQRHPYSFVFTGRKKIRNRLTALRL